MELVKPYLQWWWLNLVLVGVAVVAMLPGVRDAVRRGFCSGLRPVARRPWLGPTLAGGLALIAGAIPSWTGTVALPQIADEISYVLAADTFLHGRLTNPPHPFQRHFQTTHTLTRPTYASKYPPGQGLALAAGSLLGSMRIGAYGTLALACAVACWAVRACMPARWALLTGLMLAVQPFVFLWGQSYWGGAVAMLGGALLTGAVLRAGLRRSPPSAGIGVVTGVGLAILFNSRPFEGLLVAIALGGWLVWKRVRLAGGRGILRGAPFVLAVSAAVLPVSAWMLYYNHRVTGDVLRMPYSEHADQYTRAKLFWWQAERPELEIDVPHLKVFHNDFEFDEYHRQADMAGFAYGALRKTAYVLVNSAWPAVVLVVLLIGGARAARRHPGARLAVGVCAGVFAAHLLSTPFLRVQYVAPLVTLFAMLLMLAVREFPRVWMRAPSTARDRSSGANDLARAIALALILTFVISIPVVVGNAVATVNPQPGARLKLEDSIRERVPGEHVVLVHYGLGEQQPHEWVYNSAEIDEQPVIWAHLLEPDSNTALASHYPDRSFWLLEVTNLNYKLRPLLLRREPNAAKTGGSSSQQP